MTCKDCIHYNACSGFTPTDLDRDVFDYCRKGITDEIPDIEERCSSFDDKADFVEVVRCKDCVYNHNGSCTHSEIYDDTNYNPDYYCADGERREE